MSLSLTIVVGVGIFETPPLVAAATSNGWSLLSIWILGGFLSLCGVFCWAELASTWPSRGGEIVYVERAWGKTAGFLVAWAHALVLRPGSIATMAFPAARYGAIALGMDPSTFLLPASICLILIMTLVQAVNLRQGLGIQRILTVAKILGLMVVACCGLQAGLEPSSLSIELTSEGKPLLALILVLFTFGGWNELAYVTSEIEDSAQRVQKALWQGIAAVTVLYLLVNLGYLCALGHQGMVTSKAVAVDTVALIFPEAAVRLVAAIIFACALGAIYGLIFTGARVYRALGERLPAAAFLARVDDRGRPSVHALLLQAFLACFVVLLSRSFLAAVLYTSTMVWLIFFVSGCAVFALRTREADRHRPFRVPFHPVTTMIFCLSCLLLIYGSASYDLKGSMISVALVLTGLPLLHWMKLLETDSKKF
jgi:amino acid transporter